MQYDLISTDKGKFSLHDCRARKAAFSENRLTFSFPDGIYYNDYSDDWPNTGEAEVEFRTDGELFFYLFEEQDGCTIRKSYTMEQLLDRINSGRWEMEFGYRYDGYREIIYTGWIWQNHEPWSREFQMFIGLKEDTVFRWNPPE